MGVIFSTVRQDDPQVDGRRWTYERHAMTDGTEQAFEYLADADLDVESVARDRAAWIASN